MVNCEYCGKAIDSRSDFVRLDEDCTKRAHVKCYLQKLFPDAKPEEIKIKREAKQ